MNETPFFFDGNGYRLFGVIHDPEGEANSRGFVFCHPFAEEKLWTHRVFVNFARILAQKGYYVLRFDYMGHGDSEGEFADSSVETRLNDIKTAITWLKTNRPVDKGTGLLGLRFGATLACLAAEREVELSNLVLWEPVLNGAKYMKEMLRINLTTQVAAYKEIRYKTEALVAMMKNGQSVNIDGYETRWPLYQQSIEIDLLAERKHFQGPVLIVQINREESQGVGRLQALAGTYKNASVLQAIEEPFWKEIRRYYAKAENLFNVTIGRLLNK